MNTKTVFAIDIGTRKVAGLVLEYISDQLTQTHYVLKEHEERTMEDGQIHDIPKVAKLVQNVKEELEQTTGLSLKEASVAAAGRALKTVHGSSRLEILPGESITESKVKALELEAVNSALTAIANKESQKSDAFHCVGYSVIGYTLDHTAIANLVGQKGRLAAVEVIATFLPRMVVDSLTAVLQRAGIEFSSITLEPIAAAHVAIPKDMRRLNLALVDIGAGTSDIAITADGAVIAYGMVPKAGDEVTEFLCQKLLVDFQTAEELKRNYAKGSDEFVYTDIVGFESVIGKDELGSLFSQITKDLAVSIAQEILRLNSIQPQAVVLVGGGSLTPFLAENLATALQMDSRRIGRRGKEVLKQLGIEDENVLGPVFVTPIGIALSAKEGQALKLHNIYLNGSMLSLLGDEVTVNEALIQAGFSTVDIYGGVGSPLTVYLNGEPVIIPGKRGEPALIMLNNEPVNLDEKVSEGSHLEIIPAEIGVRGRATLGDVIKDIPLAEKTIIWEDKTISLKAEALLNGKKVPLDQELQEKDQISIVPITSVKDALRVLELSNLFNFNKLEMAKNSYYFRNGEKIALGSAVSLRLNGREVDLDAPIQSGDTLAFLDNTAFPRLIDLKPGESKISVQVELGGQRYIIPFNLEYRITVNGKEEIPGYRLKNRDEVKIVAIKQPIVADVLAELKTELAQIGSSNIVLTVNGIEAQFTTPLKDNDLMVVETR